MDDSSIIALAAVIATVLTTTITAYFGYLQNRKRNDLEEKIEKMRMDFEIEKMEIKKRHERADHYFLKEDDATKIYIETIEKIRKIVFDTMHAINRNEKPNKIELLKIRDLTLSLNKLSHDIPSKMMEQYHNIDLTLLSFVQYLFKCDEEKSSINKKQIETYKKEFIEECAKFDTLIEIRKIEHMTQCYELFEEAYEEQNNESLMKNTDEKK